MHLGRWVGLRGCRVCVSRIGRLWTGTNCRAIHPLSSSVVQSFCSPLSVVDALADLVNISLHERLPDDRRGPAAAQKAYCFAHEAEPDHQAIDTSDELKKLKMVDARLG